MRELHRGPWGPPRTNPEPRDLPDGLTVPELGERSLELIGTELVVAEAFDPATGGRRFNAGWLDETGVQVAYLTGSAQYVGSLIDEFADQVERKLGIVIARPSFS